MQRKAARRKKTALGFVLIICRTGYPRLQGLSYPAVLNSLGRSEMGKAELTQLEIDQRVYDLYDEYCHGRIDRREFLTRASALAIVGGTGLAMAQALLPRYAQAQTVS